MVLQFEWADYEADMASLGTMAREEVVAMLKRNSTGFSRCACPCQSSAHTFCNATTLCGHAPRLKLVPSCVTVDKQLLCHTVMY